MRRKAAANRVSSSQTPAPVSITLRGNEALQLIGPPETPAGPPAGRGLGKAGAKRLGRLLKRAIGGPEKEAGKERVALPKTPVRLLKHQIQSKAEDAAQTSSATLHVSQLVLSVVSQCKHRGGISMAELKQTLAAGGYDVSKNSRRLKVETKRLVNNETLLRSTRNTRTTRNTTLRLNSKTLTEATRTRMRSVKPRAAKEKQKQSPAVGRSPRGATKTARTSRAAAGSHRPAAKSQRRKTPKTAGKKRRPAANRTTRGPKAAKKTPKTETRKPVRRKQPAGRRAVGTRRRREARRRAQG